MRAHDRRKARNPSSQNILNTYAELHARNLKGHSIKHNDLWIAASAMARGIPLVSCDKHHLAVAADHPLDLIFLPAKP